MNMTVLGIDIAKSIFQLHDVDASGKAVLKKPLPRSQFGLYIANLRPCLIVMESCSGAN